VFLPGYYSFDSRYGDQHFASGYRSHLKARTQLVGASLQVFLTVIEQLIHRALLKTHEYYNLKEAAQSFVDGLRERFMKRQLLIGDEKAEGRQYSNRNVSQTPKNEGQTTSELKEETLCPVWRCVATRDGSNRCKSDPFRVEVISVWL
jgi:hypothetical protein